ncbi:hypothetical protein O9X98_15080 [Agrobacterium salinitolerans]|nr:hypothetical protein [Agrobacterium salinitolerans]
MSLDIECRNAADRAIAALKAEGHDYSAKQEDLAILFARLWHGNWDCTTDFGDGTPDLRFIQEDEYDQHLTDGPDIEKQLCFTDGHYVFFSIEFPTTEKAEE